MNLDLEGKNAFITGGSAGIGLAVARALANEGVNIIVCARNEKMAKDEARKIASEFDVKANGLKCDVSESKSIDSCVKETFDLVDGIDFLINNAGTGSNEKIMDAPDDKWQYYWNLHLMAAVRLSRAFIPSMKKRKGGVILNNASICAKQPLDYEPIYNVTKAALMMFSKCMAEEVINDNIRVNCINPGLILTTDWIKTAREQTDQSGDSWKDYLDNIAKENTPIGRFATPDELADFFVFMCSDRARYCVGSTYYVDGGWLKVIA